MAIIGSPARRHPGQVAAPLRHDTGWLGRATAGARSIGHWLVELLDESGRVSQFGAEAETRVGRDSGSRC